jgi:dTDP-L-rhamnose 4-epimerase
VLDVARELARGLGKEQLEPEVVNKFRAGDIRHCFSDISLARETLGFAPKVTFADGMRELLGWVATQQATDSVDAAAGQLEAAGLTR